MTVSSRVTDYRWAKVRLFWLCAMMDIGSEGRGMRRRERGEEGGKRRGKGRGNVISGEKGII